MKKKTGYKLWHLFSSLRLIYLMIILCIYILKLFAHSSRTNTCIQRNNFLNFISILNSSTGSKSFFFFFFRWKRIFLLLWNWNKNVGMLRSFSHWKRTFFYVNLFMALLKFVIYWINEIIFGYPVSIIPFTTATTNNNNEKYPFSFENPCLKKLWVPLKISIKC